MGLIDKDTFICIDCETTGLDIDKDQIIEVAVTCFKRNKIIDQIDTLINPLCPIPESSIAIHHITDEMVKDKPTIDQILPQITKLVGNYPIVGHGVNFDIQILTKAAEKNNIPCLIKNNPVIDTLRLARLYGRSAVNSLQALRNHFNIEQEGPHRAMADVTVNIQVFYQLVKDFKTTEQILKRLSKPIPMKTMPLGKHKGRLFKEIPLQYLRWAVHQNFDEDLLFSIRSELKKRKNGNQFSQATNPFSNL